MGLFKTLPHASFGYWADTIETVAIECSPMSGLFLTPDTFEGSFIANTTPILVGTFDQTSLNTLVGVWDE